MDILKKTFINLIRNTDMRFQRELDVNWENRMIAITGARGVGKTTFLLQHIKKSFTEFSKVLYVSMDNFYLYEHSIADIVDEFYTYGGRYLFLDEVHKFAHWSRVLKNFYDNYPKLQIVFTSSSILDIYHGDADLSRRAIKYNMHGLSFREYLEFSHQHSLPKLSLERVLANPENLLLSLDPDFSIMSSFREYLSQGYYPFAMEPDFMQRVNNVMMNVIEVDLANIENMTRNRVEQTKKVMGVISESVPFTPNVHKLADKLQIGRDSLLSTFYALSRAKILNLLHSPNRGISGLQKPDKIYMENTNLMFALKSEPDVGNVRETFFMNQVKNGKYKINLSKKTEFLVEEKYSFEIGGRNKQQKQIKDLENAFVVKDGIETGNGNVLPLWLFGLLY